MLRLLDKLHFVGRIIRLRFTGICSVSLHHTLSRKVNRRSYCDGLYEGDSIGVVGDFLLWDRMFFIFFIFCIVVLHGVWSEVKWILFGVGVVGISLLFVVYVDRDAQIAIPLIQ